jgi:ABC-2 type transport system permease protein
LPFLAVQQLTLINPMRYFLIIVRGVFLESSGIEMLVAQYWPMAVIALFSLSSAGWLFCRRMY